MNEKNHKIYSDKLDIRVLNLNCIHLATEEDQAYHIDHWARMFKAATWEDLRMVAQDNIYLNEAGQALYKMNADEMVRLQCLARLDYEREQARHRKAQKEIKVMKVLLQDKDAKIADQASEIVNKEAEIAALKALLNEKL